MAKRFVDFDVGTRYDAVFATLNFISIIYTLFMKCAVRYYNDDDRDAIKVVTLSIN